ncbi:Flp family type IVb pilin [Alienimonas chondri]|uniref:Flp family type IVb pilin n=1 Tax=Alienimonas chondri TaxID=2681879 RepID=A0ABX1VI55_9PLAN|nr:hypothetical protein [Alienimonas chondri]NNJ26912.1 hypothetical protein [Alienimonas chondri]
MLADTTSRSPVAPLPASLGGRALAAFEGFLREEEGTTAVEYAVMLALILATIFGSIGAVGGAAGGLFASSETELEAVGF